MSFSNFNIPNQNVALNVMHVLFSIPFILIGIGLAIVALLSIFGKVFVVIDEDGCYAASGFEYVNWKRRFDMRHVRAIETADSPWQSEGRRNLLIKIVADQTVKFGSGMDEDAREWMIAVLKRLLLAEKQSGSTLIQRWQSLQHQFNA